MREERDVEGDALADFYDRLTRREAGRVGEGFAGEAAGLSAEQVRQALDQLQAIGPSPVRSEAERLLLRRWGQLAPASAMEWTRTVAEPLRRYELRQQALMGWASVDPARALAYAEENPGGLLGSQRIRDVFEGARSAETSVALAFAAQADPRRYGEEAANIFWSLFGRDPAAVLAQIDAMPDGEMRRKAIDRVIDHWARHDPWGAKAWMEQRVTPEHLLSAQIELGESWARVDPAGAVAWFLDLPPEQQKGEIFDRVLRRWMQYDGGACGEWLRAQPPSPLLDRIRAERASWVVRRDPAEAVQTVRQIHDPRRRAQVEEQVVWEWYRLDRGAALNYALHEGGLGEAARQRLIERARKDAEREAAGGRR